jgi:hypothetical protein
MELRGGRGEDTAVKHQTACSHDGLPTVERVEQRREGRGGVEEKNWKRRSRASENQRAGGKTGGRFLFRMKWIEMSGSGMGGRLQLPGEYCSRRKVF